MRTSLVFVNPLPVLEELRQKLLLQMEHNKLMEKVEETAPKVILLVMKQKLARKEIVPSKKDITFIGTIGVERNILLFKYGGLLSYAVFYATYEEKEGSVVIEVAEVVNKIGLPFFHLSLIKGQRFAYEE